MTAFHHLLRNGFGETVEKRMNRPSRFVEVVAVDFLQAISVFFSDTDVVLDHQFRETRAISNGLSTVPTPAYRLGDFTTSVPTCTSSAASCVGHSGTPLSLFDGRKSINRRICNRHSTSFSKAPSETPDFVV